jgi:hypothetical protein
VAISSLCRSSFRTYSGKARPPREGRSSESRLRAALVAHENSFKHQGDEGSLHECARLQGRGLISSLARRYRLEPINPTAPIHDNRCAAGHGIRSAPPTAADPVAARTRVVPSGPSNWAAFRRPHQLCALERCLPGGSQLRRHLNHVVLGVLRNELERRRNGVRRCVNRVTGSWRFEPTTQRAQIAPSRKGAAACREQSGSCTSVDSQIEV